MSKQTVSFAKVAVSTPSVSTAYGVTGTAKRAETFRSWCKGRTVLVLSHDLTRQALKQMGKAMDSLAPKSRGSAVLDLPFLSVPFTRLETEFACPICRHCNGAGTRATGAPGFQWSDWCKGANADGETVQGNFQKRLPCARLLLVSAKQSDKMPFVRVKLGETSPGKPAVWHLVNVSSGSPSSCFEKHLKGHMDYSTLYERDGTLRVK